MHEEADTRTLTQVLDEFLTEHEYTRPRDESRLDVLRAVAGSVLESLYSDLDRGELFEVLCDLEQCGTQGLNNKNEEELAAWLNGNTEGYDEEDLVELVREGLS